jgi:mono/diheme cytochrome c family protein
MWAVSLAVFATGTPSQAGNQAQAHAGRESFLRYCSACHGTDGRGGGPIAGVLQPRPTDLTRLHLAYGQPLDPSLVEYIDGRGMPRAHGTSDMPVWGERLFENLIPSRGREAARSGTIWLIVDYLETLQRRGQTS